MQRKRETFVGTLTDNDASAQAPLTLFFFSLWSGSTVSICYDSGYHAQYAASPTLGERDALPHYRCTCGRAELSRSTKETG